MWEDVQAQQPIPCPAAKLPTTAAEHSGPCQLTCALTAATAFPILAVCCRRCRLLHPHVFRVGQGADDQCMCALAVMPLVPKLLMAVLLMTHLLLRLNLVLLLLLPVPLLGCPPPQVMALK